MADDGTGKPFDEQSPSAAPPGSAAPTAPAGSEAPSAISAPADPSAPPSASLPPRPTPAEAFAAWIAQPAARALIVFVVCWLVYLINLRTLTQIDCLPPPYAAWSLVRHGTFDIRHWEAERELPAQVGRSVVMLPDGRWVSKFPPGSTLMMLPVVGPIAAVKSAPFTPGKMRSLGKFVAMTYAAGAAAILYLLLLRLVPTPGAAETGTLLFALGTGMWPVAAMAMWPHAPAVFLLVWALWLLIPPEGCGPCPKRAALAGFALGLAVLTRQSTALFAVAWGLTVLAQGRRRDAVAMILGAAPTAVFFFWYTAAFHNPLEAAGYDRAEFYGTPWATGLGGLLVAPGRGLLVYTPALLLAPIGLWRLFRPAGSAPTVLPSARPVLIAGVVAAAASVLLYARWFEWWGGWCWGPRFLLETMPVAALLFTLALPALPTWLHRVALWLVGLSVAIQAVGVFGHPRDEMQSWNARRLAEPVRTEVLFDWSDGPIADHARGIFGKRPTGR